MPPQQSVKPQVVKPSSGATKDMFQEISSFRIFSSFIKWKDNGECDARDILGKGCYVAWLQSRRCEPKNPHEAFRRAVTAHIRGNDGRRPFGEEAERSLLKELRKKKQWKAFEGTDLLVGIKGFSSLGHHEKRQLFQKPKRKGETSIFAAQRNVRNRLNLQTSSRRRSTKSRLKLKQEETVKKELPQKRTLELGLKNQDKLSRDKVIKYDLDNVYPANFAKSGLYNPADISREMEAAYNISSKSCASECFYTESLDAFDPLLDEMIDLCDEYLDGTELSTVFERTRVSELLY